MTSDTRTRLAELIDQLADDWFAHAEALRLRRGQQTREKKGHEVLANCAASLKEALLTADVGVMPAPVEPASDRLQLIAGQSIDRVKAMGWLSAEQQQAVRNWAADDRLWTTQETVEINLATFARLILTLPSAPDADQRGQR